MTLYKSNTTIFWKCDDYFNNEKVNIPLDSIFFVLKIGPKGGLTKIFTSKGIAFVRTDLLKEI